MTKNKGRLLIDLAEGGTHISASRDEEVYEVWDLLSDSLKMVAVNYALSCLYYKAVGHA